MNAQLNDLTPLRQPRSRRPAAYLNATRRAVLAASLADRGFPVRLACELACVCGAYVAKVRGLSEADRFRLLRGEISLSQLRNGHKPKPKPPTLADHLVRSSAEERVEAAR